MKNEKILELDYTSEREDLKQVLVNFEDKVLSLKEYNRGLELNILVDIIVKMI